VAVALLSGPDVLLIHRWRDDNEYLVVPGGGVDPGETVEAAARRELREEVGIDLEAPLTPLIDFEGFDELHGIRQRFIAFIADSPTRRVRMSSAAPEVLKASVSNRYELEWIPLKALALLNVQPPEVKLALAALAR
jgi:8-oxo-dGTP pyrophosphatase MutT (NUDIX family)